MKIPLAIMPSLCLLPVIALAAVFLNRQSHALADARRDAEAAQLALKGQIVAEQESKKELQSDLAKLLAENELVKQAYEEALRAAPDAKLDSSAILKTAVAKVTGEPIHPPALEPCDKPYRPDGHGGFTCPVSPRQCLLDDASTGSIAVNEIVMKTEAGNSLVAGTAEFWRESPAPRSKLLEGKFSATLSHVDALAPPTEPRWGVEAIGACAKDGCGFGAGVLLPPVRFMGLRWEARAGAVLSGPAAGAQAGLGARW